RPARHVVQSLIKNYVNAFLRESTVFGAIEQDDVLPEMAVPVNGWSPKRIGVGTMPIDFDRQNRRGMPAKSRLVPPVLAPFPNFAHRLIALGPTHPRHRHALLRNVVRIIAEEEVQEFLLRI